MAGYLDHYGAGEEERETLVKRIFIVSVVVLVFGGLLYYIFKNHSQESRGKEFVALLRKQDYAAAYRAWGCTEAKPCREYSYDKFLEDWGPKAQRISRIVESESCNSGVILSLEGREDRLWVDKDGQGISFSPVPACPGRGAFSIMVHRTLSPLRRPFLN